MLKVDLSPLDSGARLRIDTRVPAHDPLWQAGPDLADGLDVRLEARRSGEDIIVRGEISGTVEAACRRCVVQTRASFTEPVLLVFRPDGNAAGDDEVYEFPARAREIDLGPAIRESTLLAAPEYVLCREDCAGLCPQCGIDRNEATCDCTVSGSDERWAALKRLRQDG